MIMKIVNWISTEIIRLPMVLFDRDGIRLNRLTAVEKIQVFYGFFREWGLIFYSFSSLNCQICKCLTSSAARVTFKKKTYFLISDD